MDVATLIKDKTKKTKEKVESISTGLLNKTLTSTQLIAFAQQAKDADKGTCIEGLELATKQNAAIADEHVFDFVTNALTEKAPRIKWESAKVIGNIAKQFPTKLSSPIHNLLSNTEHSGTVVRWAAAFALGEILKLKTKHNKDLLPAVESICTAEQNNGVKKKYVDALKKLSK